MSDANHIQILSEGVEKWNAWRKHNPHLQPDLSRANLHGIVGLPPGKPLLKGFRTPLNGIDFRDCNLTHSWLESCDLRGADLRGAELLRATLRRTDLSGADLSGAHLYETDLYDANLSGATVVEATITRSRLVDVDLSGAQLSNCDVYGVAAWNVKTDDKTVQSQLRIRDPSRTRLPALEVDDIEIANYLYLLVDPKKVPSFVRVGRQRVVLVLGRFSIPSPMAVLERVREKLQEARLVGVMFDFPDSRSNMETVGLLARLARFVVADLTDAKMVIDELLDLVPNNPNLPVQPILEKGQPFPADLDKVRESMLPLFEYESESHLFDSFESHVVAPAQSALA